MRLWKNHRNVTDYNVTENKTYLQKIKHKTLDLLLLFKSELFHLFENTKSTKVSKTEVSTLN